MDVNKNYYSILELDKNSSDDEIKKSFRSLSKIHHPDKGGDDNIFKEINEANSILSDSNKRNQYDVQSPHGRSYNPNRGGFNPFGGGSSQFESDFGFNINDFFQRSGFGGFNRNEVFEDLDIEIAVQVSLEDVYNNKTNDITYNRYVVCDTCRGSGKNGDNTCTTCNGTKVKYIKQTLPISNVFIVSDMQRTISFDNYGNSSKHFSNRVGRLYLTLIPLPNNNYIKSGRDLFYKKELDFRTAILGGNFEYKHLDGKTYSVKIPEKTSNGSRFKLKDKGMMFNAIGNRGDLYIDIQIIIDYTTLTDDDIEILKSLKK